jgi:diguanylate cyclase (GGDEF)-like protein
MISAQGDNQFQALIKQTEQLLQSNPKQAAEVAEQIIALAQTPHQHALGLMHLGWAERSLLQLHQGIDHTNQALDIFWQHPDLENHTLSLILLAGLEVLLGERESAYSHMIKALEQSRSIGHKLYEARACNALGALFDWYSNTGVALEYMLEALGLLDQIGQRESLIGCMTLSNIGAMYYRHQDYQKALSHYQASLQGFERLEAEVAVQMVKLNIAESLIKLGQSAQAQNQLESILEHIRQQQKQEFESFALRTLAAAMLAQGQHQKALEIYQSALEIARQYDWFEERGLAHLGLGKIFLELQQPEQAWTHLLQAKEGLVHSSSENQLEALHCMVAAKEALSDYQAALGLQRQWSDLERTYRETHAERHAKSLMLRFEMAQAQRQTEEVLLRNRDLEFAIAEKERLAAELERLSLQDPLTNLYNRRYLQTHFEQLLTVAQTQGLEVAVIVLDIDHFKQVNDQFSHLIGDQVLRQFAQVLLHNVRPGDIAARFGGEEFVVLLPDTHLEQAQMIAQRLCQAIAQHPWQRIHTRLSITTSIGLALGQPNESSQQVLARADHALYRAKQLGRNQVVVA